jgi:hypothetical protein
MTFWGITEKMAMEIKGSLLGKWAEVREKEHEGHVIL